MRSKLTGYIQSLWSFSDLRTRREKLKATRIFTNKDFTDSVRQKRTDLRPKLKVRRVRGHF